MRTLSKKDQVQINRFSIPYRIYGEQGPHIVCLNGTHQSMGMWQSFIQKFCRDYRVVIFDFPGSGRGKVISGSMEVTVDEQVEILHAVISATDLKDIVICSASWGGVVAMAYAAKHPDTVKRLILGGLSTRPNENMVETIQKGMNLKDANRTEMADTIISSFGQDLPDAMKRKIALQFETMSKDHIDAFCSQGMYVITQQSLHEVVNVDHVHAETVLINGEKDTIIDLKDVELLANQIPNCTMRVVKDVGHFLHLENENVLNVYHEFM